MRGSNFKKNTQMLTTHTGKSLNQAQLEQLYSQIEEISDDAYDVITRDMLIDMKPIPSAFPTIGQLKQQWYAYKRAHRAHRSYDREPCKFCRTSGITHVMRYDDETEQRMRVLAFCKKCDNWKTYFARSAIKNVTADGVKINLSTRQSPTVDFFVPFTTPKSIERSPEKIRPVKNLAGKMIEKLPF